MSEIPPPGIASPDIYHEYERRRRLELARTLLPIFALVQCGVFLVSMPFWFAAHYQSPIREIFAFNTLLVGIDAALHAVGLRFVRRGQVREATLFVLLPVALTVMVPILTYDLFDRGAPVSANPIVAITLGEMVATLVLIVLAGVLWNNRRSLLGTTLLMNVYTLFILTYALQIPGAGMALRDDALLVLSFPLFVQWATTGILLAASGTYQQTLRELSDVRVAYERAQQLDQLKDQFITHVNHELRSPVMALQGHVELLLLTEDNLTAAERHTYLSRAKRAGDDLVSLVTSILSMRRLEQEMEAPQPQLVNIREVLEAAIRLIDPRDGQFIERDLRLHVQDSQSVWADPVRTRQILTNLLTNAIKYSPPGTPVEVTANLVTFQPAATGTRRQRSQSHAQRAQPRHIVDIAVRDYGLSIPPDQIPLLFKRFVRLPRDLASNVPGNGLGLYLCRAFAEAMGGTVSVESAGIEGEGSTFHLRLPAAPSQEESAPSSGSVNVASGVEPVGIAR